MILVWLLSNKTPSKLLKTGFRGSTAMSFSVRHLTNGKEPIVVTPAPIVTLVKLEHPIKAPSPIEVTLLGMETLQRLPHDSNAQFAMVVTGRPSIVSGIVSRALVQFFPSTMQIVLLAVVV
jgi:hypothetical protein